MIDFPFYLRHREAVKPIVHSSQIIHQNPWYCIRHYVLSWPNGKPGEYFIAEYHPAAIVIAIQDEHILLAEQYRLPIGRTSIEFIAGAIHNGEAPSNGALRELEEEGGYIASTMETLGTFYGLNGSTDLIFHAFLARDLKKSKQHLDDSEHGLSVKWIPLNKWLHMIRTGVIQDGPTLTTWSLYQAKKL